jgi:hypothetical protein
MLSQDVNIALEVSQPDRLAKGRKTGAFFRSQKLTPKEAQAVVEEFELRYG